MKLEQPRQRTPVESFVIDSSLVAGLCLVSYGAWLTFHPAGFIVGGVLLLVFGSVGVRR